jgi:glutamate racemase
MKIGVFDSGVGGLSVANALAAALPEHQILLREDKQNLPYGTKTSEQLLALVSPILEEMVEAGCDIIVIACNTVTTNIIAELQVRCTVQLIGVEPMVKVATELTKKGHIAVFATPATLKSSRYAWLKSEYCENISVIEPDCSNWAAMVEANQINKKQIKDTVLLSVKAGADVLVLGCTHYHWIEDVINEAAGPGNKVIQPEQAIVRQVQRVIAQLH